MRVVVAALGGQSGGDLLDAIRERGDAAGVAVIGLGDADVGGGGESPRGRKFDQVVGRADREGLLRAIEALMKAGAAGEPALAEGGR